MPKPKDYKGKQRRSFLLAKNANDSPLKAIGEGYLKMLQPFIGALQQLNELTQQAKNNGSSVDVTDAIKIFSDSAGKFFKLRNCNKNKNLRSLRAKHPEWSEQKIQEEFLKYSNNPEKSLLHGLGVFIKYITDFIASISKQKDGKFVAPLQPQDLQDNRDDIMGPLNEFGGLVDAQNWEQGDVVVEDPNVNKFKHLADFCKQGVNFLEQIFNSQLSHKAKNK